MKCLFLILISFLLSTVHAADCTLSEAEKQEYLSMEFKDFDQTLNGGWRPLAIKGCYKQAAALMDAYRELHYQNLEEWQVRVLTWHAGQMFDFANMFPTAIARFEKSFNASEGSDSHLQWNAYVAASIAFLKGDLETLKQERNKIAKFPKDNGVNLQIVDHMIRCFANRKYTTSISAKCEQ
jgi:hypothetical protein